MKERELQNLRICWPKLEVRSVPSGCNLSASDLKAVLQYLDDDNSGSVSLQELQKGMNRAVREVAEAQAKLEPQVAGPASNAYDTRPDRWKLLKDEFWYVFDAFVVFYFIYSLKFFGFQCWMVV